MSSTVGSQNSYEGISDILLCYICMGKLKDACMCPHCTKISCYGCIKYWIRTSRSDCPHCRAKLAESDLIHVPSVQELSDFITSKEAASQNPRGKDYCSQHPKEQITVYCVKCAKCICSYCALFGEHKQDQGHIIKPLDELYKEQKQVLSAELHKLKDRMKEIVSLAEQVDLRIERVKIDNGKTKQEIDTAISEIETRLDDQFKVKLQRLIETKRYLKQQAREISNCSTELEAKMTGSKSAFVLQGNELKERLVANMIKLQDNRQEELEALPDVGSFVNEVVPPYESSEFKIENFKELQSQGKEVFSPQLSFCGLSFRLKVFPNGTGQFLGRYLCVFVELYTGYSQTASYQYSVEMVFGAGYYNRNGNNPLSSRNFKRYYSSDFAVGDLWGYKKFFDLNKLENEGFLVKNTLLLKFSIRHPTYHQKCRDLVLYVNDLKHKIMSLKHQNMQLRHKCQGTKDVDNHPPTQQTTAGSPESSPAHSSIKSHNTGSTQPSPSHPPSHDRVPIVFPPHANTSLTQPVGSMVYHKPDKEKHQQYHPLTPHSALISHRPHKPLSASHYGSSGVLYQQEPMVRPPAARRNDTADRRQSVDPNLMRFHMFDHPQQTHQTQPSSLRLASQPEHLLTQYDTGHLAHGSGMGVWMPDFQDIGASPGSPKPDDMMHFLSNDDHSHSITEEGSQFGSTSQSYLSQEQLLMLAEDSQKMYYDMSQPDLLYYHQHQQHRSGANIINPRFSKPPQQQPVASSQMIKYDSRVSLNGDHPPPLHGSTVDLSHSHLTLIDDAGGLPPRQTSHRPNAHRTKSLHRSQGNLSTSEIQLNIHGAPGLAGTVVSRLAADPSTLTLPRSFDGRRFKQQKHQKQMQNGSRNHSGIQQEQRTQGSSFQQQGTGTSVAQASQTPSSVVETNQHSQAVPHDQMSVPAISLSLDIQETQTPKLRSSGRRYTNQSNGKKRPSQNSDQLSSALSSMDHLTPTDATSNTLTTGHRTSSNTSLAAEII